MKQRGKHIPYLEYFTECYDKGKAIKKDDGIYYCVEHDTLCKAKVCVKERLIVTK